MNEVYYTEGTLRQRQQNRHELEEYYKFVANTLLNCNSEDLILLDVHPDFRKADVQGWELRSFFEQGSVIKSSLISKQLDFCWHGCNFSVKNVVWVVVDGVRYIADRDFNHYSVYTIRSKQTIANNKN